MNQESKPADAVMCLAYDMIRGKLPEEGRFHPGVKKALEFLSENFNKKISVNQIAQNSYVSPSHLAYLFREVFGVGIKAVLSMVRIEKAKQLLLEQPYKEISEVCSEVGFGDLRNFERKFELFASCSPKEYRQQVREQKNRCF